MNQNLNTENLSRLFSQKTGTLPHSIVQLPLSGSDRIYYRLKNDLHCYIGAFNADIRENEAFFSFTQTFTEQEIRVPELIAIADDRQHYLLSDLGNDSLFKRIQKNRLKKDERTPLCIIKKSLRQLIAMQIRGGEAIDFSKCYPRADFDRPSIFWDLNYFKYEFLKLTGTPFNEQKLEDDFNRLADYLLKSTSEYFMFRDFQSRNIMIIDNEPWFIDYQGGRRGPLQYDLASLLYSPKTKLNEIKRELLLDFYLLNLSNHLSLDETQFKKQYYGFVLIRIMQALGAYGFRGIFEKKSHFRNSIPDAIHNLHTLFDKERIEIDLPEIEKIVKHLRQSKWAQHVSIPDDQLTVRITSFSYKKGIPDDPSENGGGFVFDCRGLPNPGRHQEYRSASGLDKEVITYLEDHSEVLDFQDNVRKVVDISLKEYVRRGFNHLCVNFGCTGGQHRSVYHAEKFAQWVKNNFGVEVVLIHTEMNNWKKDE
ncbi:MAG: phosphotransferase [Prolixibacteraceae bacterium]